MNFGNACRRLVVIRKTFVFTRNVSYAVSVTSGRVCARATYNGRRERRRKYKNAFRIKERNVRVRCSDDSTERETHVNAIMFQRFLRVESRRVYSRRRAFTTGYVNVLDIRIYIYLNFDSSNLRKFDRTYTEIPDSPRTIVFCSIQRP